MNDEPFDTVFEKQLRAAVGSPPTANFDAWQARYADAVCHLNPVVTELRRRKQRWLRRATQAFIAASVCAIVFWVFTLERVSFAQTIQTIDEAHAITWTMTHYERLTSLDHQRTWLRISRTNFEFLQPGLSRQTRFDADGNVTVVEITDHVKNQTLRLDMKRKRATSTWRGTFLYSPTSDGPFGWITKVLKSESLEFVGQRKVKDKTVNVFRYRREKVMKTRESVDFWIDIESKQLVGTLDPGADYFDPETVGDRNNPAENTFSSMTIAGGITHDFDFHAKLDPQRFNMTLPEGFEFVEETPPSAVTEAELLEFLNVTARVNNNVFFDDERGLNLERINEVQRKDKADRSDSEQTLIEITSKFHGRLPLLPQFANDNAVDGTFRYVGKSAKLGTADRIVCWYKLKSTGRYRAVFGDLMVKDVVPKDLPLPVEP